MDRLTTNKEVSEMSVIELAYNSCYAKDGNARYRDYETDIDARELTIKLLEEHADIPNEFTCDEDFDDFMSDSLQYGTEDILGLIAVFYRNLYTMADLRTKLKKYEDLEEQGKLLKLPCAVGDTVYRINESDCEMCEERRPEINKNCTVKIGDHCGYEEITEDVFCLNMLLEIDKSVFLTRKEAETALERQGTQRGEIT